MKYKINQLVYIIYHKDGKHYPAQIIDIETCKEFDEQTCKIKGIEITNNKTVHTGRYGVKFLETNPTIINIPYFWEKEIIPMEN